MKYVGKELENFDNAKIWRKYTHFHVKKYIKFPILEIGAGIGSFTKNYYSYSKKIILTELDNKNYHILKKKFLKYKNITVFKKKIFNFQKKFSSIIYMNVLEHIKDDYKEINEALKKLEINGYLIILVPAHNQLYSSFDKAVGHYRRYNIEFFKNLKLKNGKITKLIYLDFIGLILYYLNYLLPSKTYPSKFKIQIWDKIFTPLTFIIDFITNYKFGKNIICVIKKIN